jgi:hypothetical protein
MNRLLTTFILLVWLPSSLANGGVVTLDNPPASLDFNDVVLGNAVIVSIGRDITIRAFREPLNVVPIPLFPALPLIFDSANPGTADRQFYLGSPYVLLVVVISVSPSFFLPPPNNNPIYRRTGTNPLADPVWGKVVRPVHPMPTPKRTARS